MGHEGARKREIELSHLQDLEYCSVVISEENERSRFEVKKLYT
jgi:hypothetical protein